MPSAYIPRNERTRQAFEKLLASVQALLPPAAGVDDDLISLAEEVVTIVQDRSLSQTAFSSKMARLFDGIGTSLSVEDISNLCDLAQQLDDFVISKQQTGQSAGSTFALLAEPSDDEGADDDDDDDDAARRDRRDLQALEGDSDGDSDGSDVTAKIPFEAVSSNAEYLVDCMRSLFPMLTPRECEVRADRVLAFLSNPEANELQIQAQLNPLLGGYDDDNVMSWITEACDSRWSVVYGLQYAKASNQKEKNGVVDRLREHGLRDDGVEEVYKHLTGTAIPGKRRMAATADGDEGDDVGLKGAAASLPLQLIDIEGIAKGHEKASTLKVPKVPTGAKKAICEFHDEIILPPTGTYNKSQRLKPIAELPSWTHVAFDTSRMQHLNPMQSIVYPCAFESDANMLVCAPTGAGKTNVALLAMLRCLDRYRDDDDKSGGAVRIQTNDVKMLYIAPMKALVQEVVQTFTARLEPLGLQVVELSGDSEASKEEIFSATLIVATPEKWDVVSRKSIELGIASLIRLCILDEVHLLHNDRGPVLESIVARMHISERNTGNVVRIVGLSATLPNYSDVAQFLHVDKTPGKGLFPFDASFRPVPLQQTYCAVRKVPGTNQASVLNQVAYTKTMEHALDAQVMVFVHSRRDTEFTANYFCRKAEGEADKTVMQRIARPGSDSNAVVRSRLQEIGYLVRDSLKDLLVKGFAVHHAGLSRVERQLVEELFLGRHVRILVCTSTLAWGVNLPAHAVIVKGTRVFNPELGRTASISFLDVLQMFGRAGRYGMDISGDACILTTQEDLPHYLGIMTQQVDIESQFLKRIVDVINAEICLGNVRSVADGVEWLMQTYFYVRMTKNPPLYGAPFPAKKNDPQYRGFLASLVHTACEALKKNKMIQYDAKERRMLPLEPGRIASHFYVSTPSMTTYLEALGPSMHDVQLFRLFAASSEFVNVSVRQEEQKQITDLLATVPIAVKEDMHSPLAKINVLLQCYISGLALDGLPLMSELVYIKDSAQRIFRALHELALQKGYGITAHRLLDLYLMVLKRQWVGVQTPLRQLPPDVMPPKDAEAIFRALEGRRENWEVVRTWTAEDLEAVCRDDRRAQIAQRAIRLIPKYVVECSARPFSPSSMQIDIDILPDFDFEPALHGSSRELLLTIEHQNAGRILYAEYFSLPIAALKNGLVHTVAALVPIQAPLPTHVFVRLSSTSWLGCHSRTAVAVSRLVIPSPPRSPPQNDVSRPRSEDEEQYSIAKLLEPFGISHLAEKLFPFRDMFPAQYEVCDSILDTADNVFVGMPPGTGKGFLGDLWIVHFLLSCAAEGDAGEQLGLLYVTIHPLVASRRFDEFTLRFGKSLKQRVVRLSGTDWEADARSVDAGNIVVCTADQLLPLVRRCHPCLRKITHIILDHLHGIRSNDGRSYECAVSRLISKPYLVNRPNHLTDDAKKKAPGPRVLALSYSLASPFEVCSWLKVPTNRIFNFGDAFRQRDAEIVVEAIDLQNYYSRYEFAQHETIKLLSDPKEVSNWRRTCVLAFVPSARDAMECAIILEQRRNTLGTSVKTAQEVGTILGDVSDADLRSLLVSGIGYLHAGTSKIDELLLYDLPDRPEYTTDRGESAPLVVFASFDAAFRIPASVFDSVIVVLPEKIRPVEERRDEAMLVRDATLSELLQMTSRAQRRTLVFSRRPRKWLYQTFLRDPLPLESSMRHFSDFSDAINSAVVQGRVKSVADIHKVLQTQFYCVHHMRVNPNYYGAENVDDIGPFLSSFAEAIAKHLADVGCVEYDDDAAAGGGAVRPRPVGQCAAFHCISCDTVESLSEKISLSTTPSILSLLEAVCESAAEVTALDCTSWRRHEQVTFKLLASRVVPLAMFGLDFFGLRFASPSSKTLLLILSALSRVVVPISSDSNEWVVGSRALLDSLRPYQQDQLVRDVAAVFPVVTHVVAAAVEIAIRKSFACARRLMHLHQLLSCTMWHANDSQLLELPSLQRLRQSNNADERGLADTLILHWEKTLGCSSITALLSAIASGSVTIGQLAPPSSVAGAATSLPVSVVKDLSRRPMIVGSVETKAYVAPANERDLSFAVDVSFIVGSVVPAGGSSGDATISGGAWLCCFNGQQGYDQAFAIRWVSFSGDDNDKDEATPTVGGMWKIRRSATLRFPMSQLGDGDNVALKVCVVLSHCRVDTEVDVSLQG